MTIAEMVKATGGIYRGDPLALSRPVNGAVIDSRKTEPGNLFAAIKGENLDGHDFAGMAREKQAVCCLVERPIDADIPYILVPSTSRALRELAEEYRRRFSIPIIGVTGSVGKTTTKEMLASLLSVRFSVLKTEGNLNNELGVPLTLFRLNASHQAAVVEMGISDFGEMDRLGKMVRPDLAVITTIGNAHLEALGDRRGVLRAKTEFLPYMPNRGVLFVNGDDDLLTALDPGIQKRSFGLLRKNDLYAEDVLYREDETECVICYPGGRIDVKIPAYGKHLVMTALAAAGVGLQLGMTGEEIKAGIFGYRPGDGRGKTFHTGYLTVIDDCYNANPDSVHSALSSLSAINGRRVCILGDMLDLGENGETLHNEIGRYAAELGIDNVICCGRLAEEIYNGARLSGANTVYFPDKQQMEIALKELIKPDDKVLVKASRGMKFETVVAHLKTLSEGANKLPI